MKKHLLRSVLMTALMGVGAMSAWAYTPTLTADYEVAGYKFKAYYNIANENVDDMCPPYAANSFTYRGSGYGLFNYGSGNRGADVTLSVAEGDLLIAEFKDTQSRSVTINSISNCTKNDNLSSGDLLAFDVTADAETVNINVGRGGCIIAFLVMEKDADAAIATYTLNYYNEEDDVVVKTVSGEAAVGGSVQTDASFFVEDVKYIRVEGEPESFTIADGENNFTVDVRKANIYSYNLLSSLGGIIASGTGFEGENATVGYPRYALVDGKFYEAAKTNNEYRKSIALTGNNASATVEYTEKEGVNTVFYAEGENVEGMNVSTYGNIPVRASNAQAGVPAGEEDVAITVLPAGKYILHVGIFTSKSSYGENTVNFGVGEETFAAQFSNVNLCDVASEEYTLNKETTISYLVSSWGDAQFDYIWIEKTGEVEVAAPSVTVTVTEIAETIVENENLVVKVTLKNEGTETIERLNVKAQTDLFGEYDDWYGSSVRVDNLAAGEEHEVVVTLEEVGYDEDAEEDPAELTFNVKIVATIYGQGISFESEPQAVTLTPAGEPAATATVTYAIEAGESFTSGQTVEVKDGDEVVATITYGEAGTKVADSNAYADFAAATADGHIEGFEAFTGGNGENGNKPGGTFYTIKPKYDGEIEVGVVLNASKAFYVVEDGTALDEYNGKTVTEKYYGTFTFSAKANKSYKVYCAASKLGFYGFNYTYEKSDDTVGISSVRMTVTDGVAYNLNGQKVQTLMKGGLYIINGKKVVVK